MAAAAAAGFLVGRLGRGLKAASDADDAIDTPQNQFSASNSPHDTAHTQAYDINRQAQAPTPTPPAPPTRGYEPGGCQPAPGYQQPPVPNHPPPTPSYQRTASP